LWLRYAIICANRYFSIVTISEGAAKKFHEQMLHSAMRAPVFFFDTTPIGRILNRFTKDIADVDQMVPPTLSTHPPICVVTVTNSYASAIYGHGFLRVGRISRHFISYPVVFGTVGATGYEQLDFNCN
jgi:ABC-type multidrug transport system fused ATPase/permease subunit